jgi:hypothetical protein
MKTKNQIAYFKPILSFIQKNIIVFILIGAISIKSNAQSFTRTTFNDLYIPISIVGGAIESTATGDNANQTNIPIGFNFGYGDSVFSNIGISTNGLIWFDAIAPATNVGNANLVTTGAPNQSLAPWFNNLIDDATSSILYQTEGTPGSQKFTIQFTNYPTFTGTPGSNVRMNCQVIIYETTNVIEFKYGILNVIGAQTTSGGAMIGMEWGTGGSGKFIDAITGSSILSHRMLSPLSGWPTYHFRFTPGAPTPVATGSYNVGVGQTYPSLTLAVADVNHRGISGSVTLNLTDLQYDTSALNGSNIFPIFVATPNGSETNRLTIVKSGDQATLAYKGSSVSASGAGFGTGVGTAAIGHASEPLLGVCASYTTIRNLKLITHGTPQTVEIGLAVFEMSSNKGAHYNYFDKISIDLNRALGGVYGIASFSTASTGGFEGTNSFNTYRDLNIKDCNVGISVDAPNNATGPADQGNQILTSSCNTYNYIGDPNTPDDIIGSGSYGVAISGQYNFIVRNCIIQNITGTSSIGDVDGIVVVASFGINEISNNIIRNVRRSSTTLQTNHWVSGIRINWNNQIMTYKIFNNSISNLFTSYTGVPTTISAIIGIYYQDSGAGNVTSEIFNNSISLNGSTSPNASSNCLIIVNTGLNFNIKNNVFANFTSGQTGVAYHNCFYTNTINRYGSALSLSDYNNYYLADTTNGSLFRATTVEHADLASWQAAMTLNPNSDVNSQVGNPGFVNNNTDLHGTLSSASLDGMGTTPPGFAGLDIDCEPRNFPYDIGFDDFTNNAIRLDLNVLLEGFYSGAGVMTPVLNNNGEDISTAISDTITVELRNTSTPYSSVATKSVLLKTDGKAVVYLPLAIDGGSYYIVIKTRNSIETWSKLPVTFGSLTSYDFN